MRSTMAYPIIAMAVFSLIMASSLLTTNVSADKPQSFETCKKQLGNGGTTEGECKQNNKNFEDGGCTERVKGKSGNADRAGQCP